MHQVVDERTGDFYLCRQADANIYLFDLERSAPKSHICAGNLPGVNAGVGFKPVNNTAQGVAHLHILNASIAHLVGEFLLFGGDNINNT